VRTSKPGYPLQRELLNAWFRFEQGQVVEWRADKGQEVLDELFQIPGARQLGEVALVDVRSPINQSGLIFHNTLFDENAVCHVAFGRAYPEGIQGGSQLSAEELDALGLNSSETHIDLMIGTETDAGDRPPRRRQPGDGHGERDVCGGGAGVDLAESCKYEKLLLQILRGTSDANIAFDDLRWLLQRNSTLRNASVAAITCFRRRGYRGEDQPTARGQ
jgi:hypothetical protein